MALRKWLLLVLILAGVLVLDQISKFLVIENFMVGESLPLLPPFLQITRSVNTGIAFGIGEGGSDFLLFLILPIVAILLFMFLRSKPNAYLQHSSLALVIAGALGNVIDRFQHGHVVDFVHVVIPNIISNVSNFADHAIVIGVFLLLIDGYLQERAEKEKNAEGDTSVFETKQLEESPSQD